MCGGQACDCAPRAPRRVFITSKPSSSWPGAKGGYACRCHCSHCTLSSHSKQSFLPLPPLPSNPLATLQLLPYKRGWRDGQLCLAACLTATDTRARAESRGQERTRWSSTDMPVWPAAGSRLALRPGGHPSWLQKLPRQKLPRDVACAYPSACVPPCSSGSFARVYTSSSARVCVCVCVRARAQYAAKNW